MLTGRKYFEALEVTKFYSSLPHRWYNMDDCISERGERDEQTCIQAI